LKSRSRVNITLFFLTLLVIPIFTSNNAILLNKVNAQSDELPDNSFLWGAASSAYQVEGNIHNNDWDYFTNSALIRDRILSLSQQPAFNDDPIFHQPANDAVRFWEPEYYEKDFQLAKEMGLNSFRISLEWARIEPHKDQWNQTAIDHYKQMIQSMRDHGLTPVVTLQHMSLPLWISTPPSLFLSNKFSIFPFAQSGITGGIPGSGTPFPFDPYYISLRGWINQDTINQFLEFTTKIASELKDKVDIWLTLNEPVGSTVGLGYLAGIWPPGFVAHAEDAKIALHNQIVAHVKAYDIITNIDNIDSDGDGIPKKVGFAHAMHKVDPLLVNPNFFTILSGLATKKYDYFLNDYFLNAVVKGEEDLNYLNTGKIQDKTSSAFIIHEDWKNKLDFLGMNYYRRAHVYYTPALELVGLGFQGGVIDNDQTKTNYRFGLLNDLGWEIYPKGIYDLMMKVKQNWNKPILITENGIPLENDRLLRPQYIISHVNEVVNAINDGVDVMGYMYWSFHDNWELHENYNPDGKFGLFTINREGREILSETKVHHAFLVGGRGDDIINQGVHTQGSQCTIDNVILILQDKEGKFLATTSKGQPDAIAPPPYISKFGARVVDSHEGTNNMEVKIHWFFDSGTAVRYHIMYLLSGKDCNSNDGGKQELERIPTSGVCAYQDIILGSAGGKPTKLSIDNATAKFGTITPDGTKSLLPSTPNYFCKLKPGPVIDPCKAIVDEINSLKRQITNLQTELKKAPTNQKSELVEMIRGLNAEVKAKNVELNQCRINNSQPPILN